MYVNVHEKVSANVRPSRWWELVPNEPAQLLSWVHATFPQGMQSRKTHENAPEDMQHGEIDGQSAIESVARRGMTMFKFDRRRVALLK